MDDVAEYPEPTETRRGDLVSVGWPDRGIVWTAAFPAWTWDAYTPEQRRDCLALVWWDFTQTRL